MVIDYLPVPDQISMHYVVGRQGSKMKLIVDEDREDKETFCWPSIDRDKKVHRVCPPASINGDVSLSRK